MDRKVLFVLIAVCLVLFLGLGGAFVYFSMNMGGDTEDVVVEAVRKRPTLLRDPFAGRENDAINIVKNFQVWKPDYIDALVEFKNSGKSVTVAQEKVTIDSLVETQFMENRFNMHFLKKGEWRALHLDTDSGDKQTPDPQYEVYLDFHDESVNVGPVWIVDVETKDVIPRNDMAKIFNRDPFNYAEVAENLKRPESVVHAITSHQFSVGIDLGGVLLLHFLKLTTQPGHTEDEIIGWTVEQEFKDDFSAYFQWKEKGEIRVAKFLFNWDTKSLEPKGLLASDLIIMGENMPSVKPVNIFPNEYTNNLNIPRNERWPKKHLCRNKDYKDICNAFVKVLEQQEFINALAWLLTNGEPDANHRVDRCKEDKKCRWITRIAGKELNPEGKSDLVEIGYTYELNQREHTIHFLIDNSKDTITPLDKISQWAYYSVTPRT